jgi:hypothetical protein
MYPMATGDSSLTLASDLSHVNTVSDRHDDRLTEARTGEHGKWRSSHVGNVNTPGVLEIRHPPMQ